MHRLARFLDPRNTIEGKIVSVILSVVLVFSMVNLSTIVENASAAGSDGDALFTTELATDDKANTQTEGGEPSQNQVITDEQSDTNTPDSNQPGQQNNGVSTLNLDDQNSDESNNAQSAPQQQQRAAAAPAAQAKVNTPSISDKKIKNIVAVDQDGNRINKENLNSNELNKNYKEVKEIAPNIDGYEFTSVTYDSLFGSKDVEKLKLKNSKLYRINSMNVDSEISDLSKLIFHYKKITLPESVVINSNDTIELNIGASTTLTATVTPENATDKTIVWSSSDRSIASVDRNGKVTANKTGETTIIATTSNGKTASVTVRVVNKATITFDANGGNNAPASQTGEKGTTITLPEQGSMNRSGYTFVGWGKKNNTAQADQATNNNVVIYPAGYEWTVENSVTLYAVWARSADAEFLLD